MADRPEIPSDIKRQLRKEARFGCCKCGVPILEYHHIKPYHIVKSHNALDMMAICPNCHYSIDSYTETQQRKFKENPYNILHSNPKGQLAISQNVCAVTTGTLTLLGDGPVITSGKDVYLSFFVSEDGIFEISLRLFDEFNKLILEINRNEWVKGELDIWDIEFKSKSRVLEIRQKKGTVNLRINASKIPIEIQGKFWINGNFVSFSKQGISVDNLKIIKPIIKPEYTKEHYFPDSTPLHFKRDEDGNKTTFNGSSVYSGLCINLDIGDKGLTLLPKPQPFLFDHQKDRNNEEAVRLLEQQIKTFKFFFTEETHFAPSFEKAYKKPIHGYLLYCKQESCLIFFLERLGVYLFSIGDYQKALATYKELESICKRCLIYDPDNILGEIEFAISKILAAQGSQQNAQERFENSIKFYLKKTGTIPFRMLNYSEALYEKGHECFCGSKKSFDECHYEQSSLVEYEEYSGTMIRLLGVPDDAKIKIFLQDKKSLPRQADLYTYEEYLDAHDLFYIDFHKNLGLTILSKVLRLDEKSSVCIYKALTESGALNEKDYLSDKYREEFALFSQYLRRKLSHLNSDALKLFLGFLQEKAMQNFKNVWELSVAIKHEAPVVVVVKKTHEKPWMTETILSKNGLTIDIRNIKRGRVSYL